MTEDVQPGEWLTLGLSSLSHAIRDTTENRARTWCGKRMPKVEFWRPELARDRCRTCTDRRDRAFARAMREWIAQEDPE